MNTGEPTAGQGPVSTATSALRRLKALANPADAAVLQGFFKTGPGEYGEGDVFLGLRVPATRKLAREFEGLPRAETEKLLESPYHEARLLGLLILVRQYERGGPREREEIFRLYLRRTDRINNWDLVDLTAHEILGPHLPRGRRGRLRSLARSRVLWERRIAIIATFHYIRQRDFPDTLELADLLLADPHDLMHKAVGWMLREVGKRDRQTLEAFLVPRYHAMPRTMLRYAIERLPEPRRRAYLKGQIKTVTRGTHEG